MTWSYNLNTLDSTPLYQVRLQIGDTVECEPQLQDEEIEYFLAVRSTILGAAAEACRSLAVKYSRSVDTTAGDTKKAYSQLAKAYGVRAAQFEQKAAMTSGLAYAGGISVNDKLQQDQNTDRVKPQFKLDMDDNFITPAIGGGNEDDTDIVPGLGE